MAVAAQIEQQYDVHVTFVWNNTGANALGFRLPGPHTVGFVCRTFYSDGSEFLTVIPLAKAVIKDPTNWPAAMDAFGRAWIAALENEAERLRPQLQPKEPELMSDKPVTALRDTGVYVCPRCGVQVPRTQALLKKTIHCPKCGTHLAKPSREQKPGSGREQQPRGNEEQRPL